MLAGPLQARSCLSASKTAWVTSEATLSVYLARPLLCPRDPSVCGFGFGVWLGRAAGDRSAPGLGFRSPFRLREGRGQRDGDASALSAEFPGFQKQRLFKREGGNRKGRATSPLFWLSPPAAPRPSAPSSLTPRRPLEAERAGAAAAPAEGAGLPGFLTCERTPGSSYTRGGSRAPCGPGCGPGGRSVLRLRARPQRGRAQRRRSALGLGAAAGRGACRGSAAPKPPSQGRGLAGFALSARAAALGRSGRASSRDCRLGVEAGNSGRGQAAGLGREPRPRPRPRPLEARGAGWSQALVLAVAGGRDLLAGRRAGSGPALRAGKPAGGPSRNLPNCLFQNSSCFCLFSTD